MLFFKNPRPSAQEKFIPPIHFLLITAAIGSFLSAITGLGGGVIFIPLLIGLVRVPLKLISPYSNMIMVAATASGALPHLFKSSAFEAPVPEIFPSFQMGNIIIIISFGLAFCAILTSRLGVSFNDLLGPEMKKYSLSALLFVLSIKLFF